MKILKKLGIILILIIIIIFILRIINSFNNKKFEEFDISELEVDFLKELNFENYEKSTYSDIDIIKIDSDTVQGYHFKPKNITKNKTIITFSGSDGGILDLQSAFLAKNGYDVYAMYYFNNKNLPKYLEEIEITNFDNITNYIEKEKNEKLNYTIIGASKGAELSLLLGNYYSNIDNIILYSPTSYNFQGLSDNMRYSKPSFVYNGKELNYLKFNEGSFGSYIKFLVNMLLNKPIEYKIFYDDIVDNSRNIDDYLIPFENNKSKILIFTGDDDKVWNSSEMAKIIKENIKDNCFVNIYEGVGHIFLAPRIFKGLLNGGNLEANKKAFIDSNEKLLEFLNEN